MGNWDLGLNDILKYNKKAFHCLRGVRGTSDGGFLMEFFHGLDKPLEFIDLHFSFVASPILREMNEVLVRNRGALRSVSIAIDDILDDDPMDVQVDLYPFTKLEHLALSLTWFGKKLPPGLWDVYKLRGMLMVSKKNEC